MWFAICWASLGAIIAVSFAIRRSWAIGPIAFTLPWFVSLSALWFVPATRAYVSIDATLLIVVAHTCFFGGNMWIWASTKDKMVPVADLPVLKKRKSTFFMISGIVISIGFVGGMLAALNTGSIREFSEGNLVYVRSDLLEGRIEMPIYERFLSAFIYPSLIFGALCFAFIRSSLTAWVFIIVPITSSILYSLAFGGRGAVIIAVPLVFWVLAIRGKQRFKSKLDKYLIVVILTSIVLYAGLIVGTRLDSIGAADSLFTYFIGPIPSLAEWLRFQNIPAINADFTYNAVVRGVFELLGFPVGRSISSDVVSVPFEFNVYTQLAEQLRDFGLYGAMAISMLLGMMTGWLETRNVSVTSMAVRATVYAYLSYSLIADLGNFIAGWWLVLLIFILIGPFFPLSSVRFKAWHPREHTVASKNSNEKMRP